MKDFNARFGDLQDTLGTVAKLPPGKAVIPEKARAMRHCGLRHNELTSLGLDDPAVPNCQPAPERPPCFALCSVPEEAGGEEEGSALRWGASVESGARPRSAPATGRFCRGFGSSCGQKIRRRQEAESAHRYLQHFTLKVQVFVDRFREFKSSTMLVQHFIPIEAYTCFAFFQLA